MQITTVTAAYCDADVYGVLVLFTVDGKDGSSYLNFAQDVPGGAFLGTVIGDNDEPFTLDAEQTNLVRLAAKKYYLSALPHRCAAEQRAAGYRQPEIPTTVQ